MSDDEKVKTHWEQFIPTDKYSLTDWYLHRMVELDSLFKGLMNNFYSSAYDRRGLIKFYSSVRSYMQSARQNMKTHIKDGKFEELEELVFVEPKDLSNEGAIKIMSIMGDFHWNSGLSKLSESRAVGDFAKARAAVGIAIGRKGKGDD